MPQPINWPSTSELQIIDKLRVKAELRAQLVETTLHYLCLDGIN